jgi:hypothetical protein
MGHIYTCTVQYVMYTVYAYMTCKCTCTHMYQGTYIYICIKNNKNKKYDNNVATYQTLTC